MHADPDGVVELVTLRVTGRGRLSRPRESIKSQSKRKASALGKRTIYYAGAPQTFSVYRRSGLDIGDRVVGPAVVEEEYTTVILPKEWEARVSDGSHLVARRSQ